MWIIVGIAILDNKKIKDQFREYDFSHNNLYIFVGIGVTLFGIIWLYVTFKSNTKYKQNIDYSKCPKCKTSYRYETLKNGICPTCDIKTIETEEYYKKYPEELDDI
jgi:ssDNA-binding Zn-finger/Zn-ribbon topoisomerase 1